MSKTIDVALLVFASVLLGINIATGVYLVGVINLLTIILCISSLVR